MDNKLFLKYKPPFDFEPILDFFRPRALEGIELVSGGSYSRTFRTGLAKGFFTVNHNPVKQALELKIECDHMGSDMEVYGRVRKMFDLDTDFTHINQAFAHDPILTKGMIAGHVPRLPGVFNPFEFVVRAILGQQITVKAATTLAARLVKRGAIDPGPGFPPGLGHFFPGPGEILDIDLGGIGITGRRIETIKTVARAILDKELHLTGHQPFEKFRQDFLKLKGIGDWTVNYVAMRGLGMMDCYPAGDLGVIKALSKNGNKPSPKEVRSMGEKWRPYRTYATLCLWKLYK